MTRYHHDRESESLRREAKRWRKTRRERRNSKSCEECR